MRNQELEKVFEVSARRNKLVKTEDRSNEHEHPIIPFNYQEIKRAAAVPKIELDGFGSCMFGLSPKILYA